MRTEYIDGKPILVHDADELVVMFRREEPAAQRCAAALALFQIVSGTSHDIIVKVSEALEPDEAGKWLLLVEAAFEKARPKKKGPK